MRHLYAFLLVALVGIAFSPLAHAQACDPIEISWPADAEEPVWELVAYPPSLSSGPLGSALEVRDVKFHGQMVLRRGHVPIINVQYGGSSNTCYRDWAYSNQAFEASNVVGTCFAQPEPGTTSTNCTRGLGVPDQGSFRGVAMEDNGDSFTIISSAPAGWYRYTISWTFEMDGTIRPKFGFSHTPSNAATNPRWHNVYWRLDFDIDGGGSNTAWVSHDGGEWEHVTHEMTDTWVHPDDHAAPSMWAVHGGGRNKGYVVNPGELEYDYPVDPDTGNPLIDNFTSEDFAVSLYRPGQYNDSGGSCAANFRRPGNPIVRDEPIAAGDDLVFWYRSGATRIGDGQGPQDCVPVGPTLTPVGDWEPVPVGTEVEATAEAVSVEAFPNPFDHSTTVRYTLDEAQEVQVVLFDALGREVRTLFEGTAPAGSPQDVTVDGSNLPNGVYTVRVNGENGLNATTRIVLVR